MTKLDILKNLILWQNLKCGSSKWLKTQNATTQIWQNSKYEKTEIAMNSKWNNVNWDKTQIRTKLKMWQNVSTLELWQNLYGDKTQIGSKLKYRQHSNYEKYEIVTKLNSNKLFGKTYFQLDNLMRSIQLFQLFIDCWLLARAYKGILYLENLVAVQLKAHPVELNITS